MSFLPLVRLWIWISVFATVAGWTLSVLGQLNRIGYGLFFCLGGSAIWFGRKAWAPEWGKQVFCRRRLQLRFRRALPLAFIFLALLILLGGVLYPPSNHTALTYRTPRVLQWLAQGHWFWIHTSNYRMNDRACGIEWLSAPLLLFTHSDRSLFLLNFFPFLLLPGLLFSLFSRLGVRGRVAWMWMWLLPTGYTFLLQAGSTANDTFATAYALAAVEFASRAWNTRRQSDLWHSLLAAALLTGAKASNLPLLLPWFVVIFPLLIRTKIQLLFEESGFKNQLSILQGRKVTAVLMLALAVLVSFVPTALLNVRYCGDWSGLALERTGMEMKNPLVGIWGNTFLFLLDNLVPPFLPGAGWWNQNALSILPQAIVRPMVANFESSFHWLGELPTEDWVGIGFGLSWLIILALCGALLTRTAGSAACVRQDALPFRLRRTVMIAGWAALLAYCVKSGMSTGARLISPYYPFLFPLLLAGAKQGKVIRTRWWRIACWIVIGLAIPVVVLTPGRPLWPANTILSHFHQRYPNQRLITRALNVYSIYGKRADPLASIRSCLPHDIRVVGFMGRGDDPDISLWRPFGQRRVEHLLVTDSAVEIRRRGIEYIVAGEINFGLNGATFEGWKQQTGVELVKTANATVRVSEGPQPWYIVRLIQ